MAWEDDSSLEWYVYLSNDDISTDGYVSNAVGGYAVGPMPQDEQLAIILPKEAYDSGKTYGGSNKPIRLVSADLSNWLIETAIKVSREV